MDATITTSGTGAAAGTPDAMRLHLGVTATSRDVEEALAGVSAGVLRLGHVAREHTSGERITTRGMELWSQRDDVNAQVYRASQSVDVLCDSFDSAGKLLAQLGGALGRSLEIRQVQPLLTATDELEKAARAQAFENARAKAEELAALAGRQVGAVVTIREGGGDHTYDEQVMVAASEARVPFEAGSMNVTASLTVTWTLG